VVYFRLKDNTIRLPKTVYWGQFNFALQTLQTFYRAIRVLSSCPIHPREVFKPAILANAAGIILLYNHPSGDLSPSQDDILLTDQLKGRGGFGDSGGGSCDFGVIRIIQA
jgi:hypothetical protein